MNSSDKAAKAFRLVQKVTASVIVHNLVLPHLWSILNSPTHSSKTRQGPDFSFLYKVLEDGKAFTEVHSVITICFIQLYSQSDKGVYSHQPL